MAGDHFQTYTNLTASPALTDRAGSASALGILRSTEGGAIVDYRTVDGKRPPSLDGNLAASAAAMGAQRFTDVRGIADGKRPPLVDSALVAFAGALGIPGFIDVHAHFMPESVMRKVWAFFDSAADVYGTTWPVQYRLDDDERLELIRGFGVKAFTSMIYAHKPGMSAWLNDWSAQFAATTPDCLHTATFFPEADVADYVSGALSDGARVFKVHLQVGGFDPRDPLLDAAWGLVNEAGIPIVVHCGSGPITGPFTGPGPMSEVLKSHKGLQVIVAHMGSREYGDFLSMTERHHGVRLDTTMAFTHFMEKRAPYPKDLRPRLADAGLRGDVLFGSDFPNIPYPYAEAIDALVRLGLGDEWLRAVLWESASEIFNVAG